MKRILATPRWFTIGILAVFVTFFITRLWHMANFPVFADEAIYIRWAQLIMDDWKRYLFFPLNDGKTPLFIWLLVPFQYLFSDQLLAARFVAMLFGIAQLGANLWLCRLLGGRRAAQLFTLILTTILPFWVFAHRMALMDGALTFMLTLVTCSGLMLLKSPSHKQRLLWGMTTGISLGAAVWLKLPALFFFPTLFVLLFAERKYHTAKLRLSLSWLAGCICIALLTFVSLRISPSFGQLFSRGQDFTFSIGEVVGGRWTTTLANIPKYFWWLVQYFTWPVIALIVSGIFLNGYRRKVGILLLISLLFCLPFIILGKVVYPRYFLPVAPFLTVAAALVAQGWSDQITKPSPNIIKKIIGGFAIAMICGQLFTQSLAFMIPFLTKPDATPFVASDREQYLEEWSSGHGIRQTVKLITDMSADESVAVATEGRFGTLPDGLLLFFHRKPIDNIYIEGIDQYPVKSIPSFFIKRAKTFDRSLLVVNSHRLELKLPAEQLMAEYCRPNSAPCLQIWDVTPQVRSAE